MHSHLNSLQQTETPVSHSCIQSLLLKFAAQELIEVREPTSSSSSSTSPSSVVVSVDHAKLWAMIGSVASGQRAGVKRKAEEHAPQKRASGFSSSIQSSSSPPHSSSLTPASNAQLVGASTSGSSTEKKGRSSKNQTSHLDMEIENLLNQQSTKEQQSKKVGRTPPPQYPNQRTGWLAGTDAMLMFSCQVKQRDSRAAQHQHSQGAVHRGKVPVSWPSAGPRVL